jgi:hypothetical protein
MRRHVHSGNHAAESFVSFIPLLGDLEFLQASQASIVERVGNTPRTWYPFAGVTPALQLA